ncbi:Lysosomal alpha-mannosidase [Armadillidium nasatum]|uniref:Alpha-mannosidase n=1 Tax=Armadillidium nasatum TaxID=96803 RepID=A0A5N5T5W6_9CRUS|nr:Lysosomal alpha-mannosidase [Armadillidium nasatum]
MSLIRKVIIILSVALGVTYANPTCPTLKPGMINVHLVCHTHDDVGWLKTVDQYYYGSRKRITWVGVQYILDSVMQSLLKDQNRKFIYVESAFFFRWWNEQDEKTKSIVQASLFAQMGMDGLFFGRLDYDDKRERWNKKQMEMVWKGSNSLGEESWIFTGALPNGYSPPKGFCFDLLCPDDPIMDDPRLEDYNKEEMVDTFLSRVDEQRKGYATYVNARQKNGSRVNLVYSTPSCYVDALHNENIKWPTKTDDFFPYSSDPHAFWTGYFTSRPTLKGLIRKCNNLLQAIKQVSAILRLNRGEELERLAEAMAVAQHHDAVTGTAKQHVTDDYYKRLFIGMLGTNELLSEGFRKMTQSSNSVPKCTEYVYCPLLNISSCPFTEDQQSFVVNIYNPVSRVISSYVRIPIIKPVHYEILNEKEEKIEYNVIPLPKEVKLIPGRDSKAEYELVFLAKDLPAFGVQQYLVSATNRRRNLRKIKIKYLHSSEDKIITKGDISVTLDGTTNKLKYIEFGRKKGKTGKIEVYSLVAEIHQQWTTWVSQVLRIYKDKNYVESDWLVGPIPIEDGIGKEIVNQFHFKNLKTNQTFYTDANGREMQKRVKDFRPTWKLNSTEPVSQNYYPVTSRIIISSSDGKTKAAIMNDRAQNLSLSNTLPLNIRILTLEPWREGDILLRLENYYEKGESSLSGTTSVNLKETFAIWPIKNIEELTLGANKLIKDNKRLKWKTRDEDVTFMERERNSYTLLTETTKNNPDIFTFSPMQIRTFVLKF